MVMGFRLAVVPFSKDGQMHDLYIENTDDLKDGVIFLENIQVEEEVLLRLNSAGVSAVNAETNGAFLELTDGRGNHRYVLLEPRHQVLDRLVASIPDIGFEHGRKFLKALVQNDEAALEEHGSRAALVIY